MTNNLKPIDIQRIFTPLILRDLKLLIQENGIKVNPTSILQNVSFLLYLSTTSLSVFVFFVQNDLNTNLVLAGLLTFSIFSLLDELKLYSSIELDFYSKEITVIPHKYLRFAIKNKILSCNDLKSLGNKPVGSKILFTRYLLLASNESNSELKLLSSKYKDDIEKVREALLRLF